MIRSLNSGVSGIQQFQEKMDVIGNNIANVNTTGFKSARVDFADAFSDTLRQSSSATGTSSGTPSLQIGSGVSTSAVRNIYTQGAITTTGYQTDMAISGDGFFVVKDPLTQAAFVTRAGNFRLDANNFLVTDSGMRVQGFNDTALATRGDIAVDASQVPSTVAAGASMTAFSIDLEGHVKVKMSDGSEFTRGQILLQRFSDPQSLQKEGLNLYSGLGSAGPLGGTAPLAQPPGSNGLGRIESGALELSNVDLAGEFTSMITTQRAFQACARVITTSDEMLQELVSLKR
ncbi:MAG: flagellar hook-basal body protein [Verrucomicrobiales bacterium]|nr:flagellar hook-basal body protein [Verrucomicrobiales bacterium]